MPKDILQSFESPRLLPDANSLSPALQTKLLGMLFQEVGDFPRKGDRTGEASANVSIHSICTTTDNIKS